jgi:hypothetical protein
MGTEKHGSTVVAETNSTQNKTKQKFVSQNYK